MIRHFAPGTLRLVSIALVLAPCVTSTSPAGSSETSAASEWTTSSEPLTFALHEGVKLTLAPGTKIVRQPSIPVPRHLKDVAPRAYAIELITGRLDIDIDVKKKPIYSVMVRGPRHVSAFTTGGHSTVLTSSQGVVLASVSGSELTAGVNDKWRALKLGTALVVSREMPSGTTHNLLNSPQLKVSNSLKISLAESGPSTLSWATVPEARDYRISLYRRSEQGDSLVNDFEVPNNTFELPKLETGLYAATVCAVDRWRMGSPPSNPVTVRVVGVQLPEGAYMINGVPQLGRSQHVALSQIDGLEMAYGTGMSFQPAPATLGIRTGRSLFVRFREVGSSDEVKLTLEPRTIQSSLQFEPKSARWPGQAVKVIVRLSGPNGTDLPSIVDVKFNASVNARPIETHWAHEGHIWQTRIEQPPLAGPWVLRITVTDQGGQVLAHDFLEIAETRLAPAYGTRNRYASQ